MYIENRELLIFASALILITLNILVCSLTVGNRKYHIAAILVIRATAITPGFIAVCWGLFITLTENDTSLGWALFSAGILLETGALQLSSILRKQVNSPNKAN